MGTDFFTGENTRKPKTAAQDWRVAKENLSKSKTYESAVELQRATRILKNTVRFSLVVHENHK